MHKLTNFTAFYLFSLFALIAPVTLKRKHNIAGLRLIKNLGGFVV